MSFMEWMLDIQLGRRNLSPIQRIAIAETYRSIYEKQARENMSLCWKIILQRKVRRILHPLLMKKIDVRDKLEDMIGISIDTLSNYKKLTELVPELQNWVETGILTPTTAVAKYAKYIG